MSGADQREQKRVSLKVEISLHSETNFYTGFTMNISAGGLFIATHVPAKQGEELPITFTLPGSNHVIDVTGIVMWSREYNPLYPETHPGMGISFGNLKPEDAKLINNYINTTREPYFHPSEDE